MRPGRRNFGAEEGQAMVEFALVLPIILLLLFGMLQFALVLNARQTVAYAAQAAANGYAQSLQRARGDAEAGTAGAQVRPEFARSGKVSYSIIRAGNETAITADGTGQFGDLVVARATYGFPSPVRAGIGTFRFPDTIMLSAEAVARIEAAGVGASGTSMSTLTPAPMARPTPTPTPTATPRGTPTPTPTRTPFPTPTPRCGYVGIGITVSATTTGYRVGFALPGGPADRAGIKAGDTIIAADALTGPSVVSVLRGAAFTNVNVVVQRGAQQLRLSVMRDLVVWPASYGVGCG